MTTVRRRRNGEKTENPSISAEILMSRMLPMQANNMRIFKSQVLEYEVYLHASGDGMGYFYSGKNDPMRPNRIN